MCASPGWWARAEDGGRGAAREAPANAFNVDNFLTPDGEFARHAALLHFGTGKRDCMGRAVAERELLALFAALLLNFRFTRQGSRPLVWGNGLAPRLEPTPRLCVALRGD